MRKHKHKVIVLLAIAILLVGCTSGGTDNEVNSDTETRYSFPTLEVSRKFIRW